MRATWSPESAWPFDITLEWDPNSEPELAGYKIHYGKISLYQATYLIEKWCQEHEPRNTQCIDEWKEICDVSGQPDPSCHLMLFQYDHVVEVGDVTKHTLIGLDEGAKYYFDATAYSDKENLSEHSQFSIELNHRFGYSKP